MKKTLLISPAKCIGCLNCELACASRHWTRQFPAPPRIRLCFFKEGGNVPVTCFQCDSAPCAAVCPSGALSLNAETGVIEHDPKRCLGCRACVLNCPFGHAAYDFKARQVLKCDQCQGSPRCAAACPAKAIEFRTEDQITAERRRNLAQALRI
jgi:Fe-S-cluster-containing hydrogenase component 2